MKHLYYRAFQEIDYRRSLARLRRLEQQLTAPETRLAIPFLFKGYGFFKRIRPKQSQMEIGRLFQSVMAQRPRTVLEIGTCHGGTLYLWCQAAHPEGTLVGIDLPEGEFGGGYHSSRTRFYAQFAQPGQRLHLLRADSHAPQTADQVRTLTGANPVDFLFIDGDHTYEGVKQDFLNYSPMLAEGGTIAFHDILKREDQPRIEVWKLWLELKRQHECHEWVDTLPGGRPIGIGVIRWRK